MTLAPPVSLPGLTGGRLTRVDVRRRRLLTAVWGTLFLNVLAFSGLPTVFPIPGVVGQLVTQGTLPLALMLALMANPRGVMSANPMLLILTLAGVVAAMVSLHNEFLLGSMFRAARFLAFLGVLWLLTPWFHRRDMLLLRAHRICLWVVLGVVVLGALLAPGLAFSFQGRLSGVLWPIPPTQVAHYAAVLFGTTALLWMSRVITNRNAAVTLAVSAAVLIGSHTRTALIALLAALVCAGATLFVSHARVRRTSLLGGAVALAVLGFFASEVTTWALRGQTAEEAGNLTGRTQVWLDVFGSSRPLVNDIFGSGLSNLSWKGLPIDSNWVATYLDQGLFGVALQVALVLVLLLGVLVQDRGPHKAIAMLLVVYCLFASITETGLGNPSPYWLDLAAAASLLRVPRSLAP